jgi:large subunit ribosomal protein L22
MKVRAHNRFVRQSPYKVRRVLDLVRGLPVEEAEHVLRLTNRAAAKPIAKALSSAIANAEHNHALDDEGPTLRRFKPRARGRATRIDKRTSHITIVLSDVNDVEMTKEVS